MRFEHPISSIAVIRDSAAEPTGVSAVKSARRFRRRQEAFTMIEIALCLAIIGFALVAIIGVLPTGMGVQKDNREETIINQDATMWMDTIRSGSLGHDDLTNYVIAITNIVTEFDAGTNVVRYYTNAFTPTSATRNGMPLARLLSLRLTNGLIIVGLLSKPTLEPPNPISGPFISNYMVATVRSMSGPAVDKAPQKDRDVLDTAFSYRMIVENSPYVPFNTDAIDMSPAALTGLTYQQLVFRTNMSRIFLNSVFNSHDLRLTFRWPLLPNGTGNGRQHFRTLTAGSMMVSTNHNGSGQDLYFFQPSTYAAKAQ
jgi:type II secretory pathway pseudopilin PulG